MSAFSDYFTIVADTQDPSAAVIRLSGEFDMNARDELLQALLMAIGTVQPHDIVVDLDQVTFMDSEAISAIVDGHTAARVVGVSVRLRHAHGVVHRVLDVLGLLTLLNHPPADVAPATGNTDPDT